MSPRVVKAGVPFGARPVEWSHRPLGATAPAQPAAGTPPAALAELEIALEQCRLARERCVQLESLAESNAASAYQQGFEAGRAEERVQSQQIQAEMESRVTATIAELAPLRAQWLQDAEQDLVRLAVAVARRVLHREITLVPHAIRALVRIAFEKTAGRGLTRILVHPGQEQAVREAIASLPPCGAEVVVDASLDFCGVRFETPHGFVDASLEAQLQEMERGLADDLRR